MIQVLAYCDRLPEVALDPGSVLIREGERLGHLFILVDGEVEVLRGDVAVARVREPGAIFGEMSALLDMPYTASVRARTHVKARFVENAQRFLQDNPDLAYHLARMLARRLRDATTYLVDFKRQFADRADHLGMIDGILESLLNQQREDIRPGSGLGSDPRL